MGIYSEIKSLIKDLNESKIKQRRMAGEKLQSMLSQPETRRRLAMEVSIPPSQRGLISIAGARRMALAEVWRLIIQSAISAVQAIVDGKSKITESDILMPYKLIRSCDMHDEVEDASIQFSNTKLDKKTTRIVFEYTMEMLENRTTLELAEMTLLQQLAYICSRREYVAYFKPHGEISAILEEVESRILSADGAVESRVTEEAGKLFGNIVKTTIDLGIGLEILIPGCVKMAANWCKLNKAKNLVSELPHVLNGLSLILESNPEQSVAPLFRYGHIILSFVQKRYSNTVGMHRNALNKYLLRHLITSQVAGKVNGMMPGDMGNLGDATLTFKKLSNLLDLLFHDLGKLSVDILPMDQSLMIHIELIARLLSCAQRSFLYQSEWNQIKDPMKELMSTVESTNRKVKWLSLSKVDECPFPSTKASDLDQSPFVQRVLAPLYSLAPDFTKFPDDASDLLDATRNASSFIRPDTKLLAPLLQVLVACSEIFPTGSCWASNISSGWNRLKIEEGFDSDSFLVNNGSHADLATVVYIITNVLETYGSSSGSPVVQKCALTCLIRLTEATAISIIASCEKPKQRCASLCVNWRRVWTVLFRPDLRYASLTKETVIGSNGELVLLLLIHIIKYACTDAGEKPTSRYFMENNCFLASHQGDLWSLPVFANANSESPVYFMLIYSVLFYIGLKEYSPIDQKGEYTLTSESIRHRLLKNCLIFCEKFIEKDNCRLSLGLASICAASLCHGCSPSPPIMFDLVKDYFHLILPTFLHLPIFDEIKSNEWHHIKQSLNLFSDLVTFLWGSIKTLPRYTMYFPSFFLDDVLGDVIQLRKLIATREQSLLSSDFIAQFQSKQLFDFLHLHLETLFRKYVKKVDHEASITIGSEDLGIIALSTQTLVTKLYLTPMLSRGADCMSLDIETVLNIISEVFSNAASRIGSEESNDDDNSVGCSDLSGIVRGVLDVACRLKVELSLNFVEKAGILHASCENLLECYVPGGRRDTSLSGKQISIDDDLMDDEVDEMTSSRMSFMNAEYADSGNAVGSGRKRKRTENRRNHKQRSQRIIQLKQEYAFRIGELLVALCPSSTECEFVAKALTGIDDLEDALVSQYNVDMMGCLHALDIISADTPLLCQIASKKLLINNNEYDSLSLPTLICHLIKLLRTVCKPFSTIFLYGYSLCAQIVSLVDADLYSSTLTEDEAVAIVDLFRSLEGTVERRHLPLRPSFRILQLRSAISMFEQGKTNFHSVFDKEFPRLFVLPSLLDVNAKIRRLSCKAVSSAMQVLPEDRVIESVRKRLHPIASIGTDEEVRVEFRAWYDDKLLQGGDSKSTRDKQVWEDSFQSVQYSVIECLGTIAITSRTTEYVLQVLFDLIRLCSRRTSLQGLVYHMIEKIAIRSGHENADRLLEIHREGLLLMWLQNGDSLFSLPLAITCPVVLSLLLKHGKYHTFVTESMEADVDSSKEDDYMRLQENATSEFLSRNSEVLLPQMVVIALRGKMSPSSTVVDLKNAISTDGFIQELCSVFEDSFDDKIIKMLFRKNMPYIMAQSTITTELVTSGACDGVDLNTVVQLYLSEDIFRKEGKKHASTAIRRMIELFGHVTNSVASDIAFNSIQRILDQFCSQQTKSGDLFENVSSSATEALVFAKFCLDKCVNEKELSKMWFSFELILRFIIERIRRSHSDCGQLSFCVLSLLGILVNERLEYVRCMALDALTTIVNELADQQVKKIRNGLMKDLICVVFHVHESYQRNFIDECIAQQELKDKLLGRSLGALVNKLSGSDLWGWVATPTQMRMSSCTEDSYSNHVSKASSTTVETIVASFKVLHAITNVGVDVGLTKEILSCLPLEVIPINIQKKLADTNPLYCAQIVIRDFIRDGINSDDLERQGLPAIIARIQAKNISQNKNDSSATHYLYQNIGCSSIVSANQTLLMAELTELEKYLSSQKEQFEDNDKIVLTHELRDFCASSNSEQVRLLASKCLGEINISTFGAFTSIASDSDWVASAVSKGRLLTTLKVKTIEVLVKALKSHESMIAMTALETLKAVLSSRISDECREFFHDPETMEILEPFFFGRNEDHVSKQLMLDDNETRSIFGDRDYTEDKSSWCWNTSLWTANLDSEHSFEAWICRVVPALLVCCYDTNNKKKDSTVHDSFFLFCQRMSYVDPAFSEALFPAIVLDLLLTSGTTNELNPDRVLVDTWVSSYDCTTRVNLSECFNAVFRFFSPLGDESKSYDKRPVAVAVRCLDLLRRLTQYRFESSRNHRRNPTKGSVDGTKKNANSDSVTQDSSNDINRGNCTNWRGIPYGIVLSLDGILVANACILSSDFAAGLFYAEMFIDSRYHGAALNGDLFSKENDSFGTRDISGFGELTHDKLDFGSPVFRDDVVPTLNVLRKCYTKIGEHDAVRAAGQEIADFSLFSHSSVLDEEISNLERLELLENFSDMENGSVDANLLIAEALEGAGLRNTLSTYVQGLMSKNTCFRNDDQASLKEKWFMCRLYDLQWDDQVFQARSFNSTDDGIDNFNKKQTDEIEPQEKSSRWDLAGELSGTSGFYESMSRGLLALREEDFETFYSHLRNARLRLVDQITLCGSDDAAFWKTLDVIDKLRIVNDLEILSPTSDSVIHLMRRINSGIGEVGQTDQSPCLIFKYSANLHEIALKTVSKWTVHSLPSHLIRKRLIALLQRMFTSYCEFGLSKDADSTMHRLYAILRPAEEQTSNIDNSLDLLGLRIQKACLLERKNDFSSAIRCTKQTIRLLKLDTKGTKTEQTSLMVDALVSCGEWMTKHKVEPASSVLSDYFRPAAKLSESLLCHEKSKDNTTRCIHSLLALSDLVLSIFDSVTNRVKSLSWQKAGHGLEERRLELVKSESLIVEARKRVHSLKKKTSNELNDAEKEIKELQIYRIHLDREIQNTESERQQIQSSLEEHRILAMQSIVSALRLSGLDEAKDISRFVYRLIAMWFSSEEDNVWTDEISSIIECAIENVPSFRFVSLTSQLFSRISASLLSSNKASSQSRLQILVLKMCLQHPYHCVVPLLALSNGVKGTDSKEKNLKGSGIRKADVACELIRTLKNEDSDFIFPLIDNYERLTSAYIHLAMADTKDFHRGNTSKIPMEKVCKSTNQRLDKCLGAVGRPLICPPCVMTKPPPVRPGCDYGDGLQDPIGAERIISFESFFAVTDGGLHRPKIVICIGSKGGRYRELVKGEDETRQDAVMEQVFDYVNGIMARQRVITKINQDVTSVSNRSNLKLFTYNIIPLSPEAGVLEWVNHAIPFGDFIADKGGKRIDDVGAHSRYYPGEWGHVQCRNHLSNVQQNDKRSAFDAICDNNSPVFRFFFIERFGQSLETWYAAKMRYTRSVAVSSVVGHILGIGDRHTSNILVHQKSGEVVHIDFGIVFEQGKLLNTPEKVPFRLTRNIVDGMGPLGTEGTFTKAAEATLEVLKDNSYALLTILSAIVADPLYKWSISSHQNQRKNNDLKSSRKSVVSKKVIQESFSSSEENDTVKKNEAAAHTIRKIHEKLQGYEDGTSEQQSVVGQISLLINSARDRDNLCSMFPGWAPWV